jgi:hypothetical protein
MLNFHLEVAAAKAAVERKDVITAGSAGRHVPSNPSSSRAFTSAFPHDNEEGNKKGGGEHSVEFKGDQDYSVRAG